MQVCTQLTAKGEPCRSYAVAGFDACAAHLGRAHRHTLYTPELGQRIVAALRAGAYTEVAARAVGVGKSTLDLWLQRGRRGELPYTELADGVEQARAEGEVRNVATIANAAQENWQAAAWLLERGYPERWGRVSTRMRLPDKPPEEQATPPTVTDSSDPFTEVDELAAKRHGRTP